MEEFISKYLFNPTIGKMIIVIVGIAVVWTINKFVKRSIDAKISNNNVQYKAKKFVSFGGYILVIILISVVYSSKLGGLTVAFGIAGAGIAFALQEVIASFAGWLAILISKLYTTGDRVQLGGIKGDVMDIGVLRTTIMELGEWVDGDLYNGRIVLISNSYVFKAPVFNYSGDFPFLWDEIKIPIQYGSNYEKTSQILQQIGNDIAGDLSEMSRIKWKSLQSKYRLEEAQTEPMVSLIANDNWVEFTLRYVVNYKKRRVTKTILFTRILKEIEATNGEIKFASATFQIVDSPQFDKIQKK